MQLGAAASCEVPETSTVGTSERETGYVSWFNGKKGYGFVIADTYGSQQAHRQPVLKRDSRSLILSAWHWQGARHHLSSRSATTRGLIQGRLSTVGVVHRRDNVQLFVHHTEIHKSGHRCLGEGEPVEFLRGEEGGKLQAWDVTGPGGDEVHGEHRISRLGKVATRENSVGFHPWQPSGCLLMHVLVSSGFWLATPNNHGGCTAYVSQEVVKLRDRIALMDHMPSVAEDRGQYDALLGSVLAVQVKTTCTILLLPRLRVLLRGRVHSQCAHHASDSRLATCTRPTLCWCTPPDETC
eukprot:375340-Prorocentrum_minimum.AAC.1